MTADHGSTRPRVLLSAYACEPNQGSEPGVGWRWAHGLSERTELTVLTREANRAVIQSYLDDLPEDHTMRRVRFLFHDLGPLALAFKKRGLLPTFAYYVLWQKSVAKKYKSDAEVHDIVHHLTFCSLLCPGLWRLNQASSVIGPVGAPLVSRHYLPVFGRSAIVQRLRGSMMRSYHRMPWLKRVLRQAKAIVPANSETADLLRQHGFGVSPVMLDTGSPETEPSPRKRKEGGIPRFLYAGRLERRKGLELALRALALAREWKLDDWEFEILGDGPDRKRLEGLTAELGLGSKVFFTGSVSHDEVQGRMRAADVFFFTSVRDTSGGVNLEAMSTGLPILCIAHQGVGDITDTTCAIRIPPGEIGSTIHELALGIQRLCTDEELRHNLGKAARLRALKDFRWDEKFDRMVDLYRDVLRDR